MSPELLDTVIAYGTRVVGVVLLLLAAFTVGKWARRKTYRRLERSPRTDPTLNKFLAGLAYYAIVGFALLASMNLFGIDVTSFVAVLAAAGFAVGLAFQGSLSNFAAGVMLLVFRPFGVDDKVSVAGVTGTVDEVGLFTSTLDTPDNRRFIVPNSEIFGSTIENYSYHDSRRVDVAVGTDYEADLGATRSVLETAAASVEGRLEEPEPQIYLDELGGSSINWSVRVWAPTEEYWGVRERLTRRVKDALDDAGIGIPYPNMDVHVDGWLERGAAGE